MGVLIDAINCRNNQNSGIELPLPQNPSQVDPYIGLLEKESAGFTEPAERLSGFAPLFRSQIEKSIKADPQYSSAPFLPASEQTNVVLAWHSVWDALPVSRKFEKSGVPKPPSVNFSREVLSSTQEEKSRDGGIKVPTGRTEVLDAVAKQEKAAKQEKEQAAFRELMSKVRESRNEQSAINEQERIRRELRMKEEQELDEIKGGDRDETATSAATSTAATPEVAKPGDDRPA